MIARRFLFLILLTSATAFAADKPTTRPATIRIPDSVVTFDLILVPAGEIVVKDKDGKERSHKISPFWIGKTEVTWDEVDLMLIREREDRLRGRECERDAFSGPSEIPFCTNLDGNGGHSEFPAVRLTARASAQYCRWLSHKTGMTFRLPTEVEWEYACRAGGATLAPDANALDRIAWFDKNTDNETRPVGKKHPNAWGIHDMLGNVAEWVVREDGTFVTAGGSFAYSARDLHSAAREEFDPRWQQNDPNEPKNRYWLVDGGHIGLRLVRDGD